MINDWNNLRYLWALRESGTMRRAAEMLGTSPTTVSRHIRTLTQEFGEILALQTKGEDWVITSQGASLVDLAAEFHKRVADLDHLTDSVKSPHVSITSLDFVSTYFLAPQLSGLLGAMPELKVSLLSSDRRLSLAFNEVDIALRFGRPDEGQLVAKRVSNIEMRVWQPKAGPTQNWVGMTEDLDWTPDMKMARKVFGCDPTIRTSSYAAAKRTASALGYGTIGPDVIMAGCPQLVPHESGEGVCREIWSVIHESRRVDQNLMAVKDWIDCLFSKSAKEPGSFKRGWEPTSIST